jgi:hypothetical protein
MTWWKKRRGTAFVFATQTTGRKTWRNGPAVTRKELIDEIRETRRDLRAFIEARDALQRRVREMDDDPCRQEFFTGWAATAALLNVIILATTRCEGLLEDYQKNLDQMETPDNVVRLVRET